MKKQISQERRNLLKGLAGTQIFPFIGALSALQGKQASAADGATSLVDSPYGPIVPTNDQVTGLPLLQLPPGFSYSSFGWRGDLMADGRPCPGGHDGMGVISDGSKAKIVLVRNHELGFTSSSSMIEAPAIYDRGAGGGTTTLTFKNGNWLTMEPSLGGTLTNCAGGVTPWGTWLTCEEVGSDSEGSSGKKHGYVFEVHANPDKTKPKPIVGMGRFKHEAAAVDPETGIVYMTEDSEGKAGFYRYVPTVVPTKYGNLVKGGTLQMARVKGVNNANLAAVPLDSTYVLEWVNIADPDRNRGNARGPSGISISDVSGPFAQGWSQGALRMNRGEGAWQFQDKVYVMDTAGGSVARGALWELDLNTQTFKCIYSSPGPLVGNMGDNITVSPGGGLLLCEDGGSNPGDQFGIGNRLMGLTSGGDAYIFAKNNVRLSNNEVVAAGKTASAAGDHRLREFCGACFDPTGRYLFVNIQTPGITFAITGPWDKGPLRSTLP
ncbi:MAG: PhoX family protein [Burkholderiaceae bacterium]